MYSYTLIQWLFLFYFYCFCGWCFESAYVSLKSRKPVNRGFMKGPFLPLYGSGAIMMLVVSKPFLGHWWAVYIAGCIGATLLEYVTGVVMEALFKVRYWDYSNQSFNFQGQVCLSSTLAWGGLTLLMNYVIHKPIEKLVLGIAADILSVATILLTMYIACDFALSFKEALDLRDILVRMEKAKEELLRLQKRLDVMLAVAGEEWSEKKEAFSEKFKTEEIKAGIEKRLNVMKELLGRKPEEYSQDTRDELLDLHAQYKINVEKEEHRSMFYHRIRNNPSMSSRRYKEALEELKKKAAQRRKK